jgi:hypothetical protein
MAIETTMDTTTKRSRKDGVAPKRFKKLKPNDFVY